jgi:hypothetical protein
MEKQPEEVFEDIGVTRFFGINLSVIAERLRERTELAAEPLTFAQDAIVKGIKRARGYASSLVESAEYGDNYPAEPAMIYARIESNR